jgi:hypothetical protein
MKNLVILLMTISILLFTINVGADGPYRGGYQGGGQYHGGYRGGVTNNYYNTHHNNNGSYWWVIPGAVALGAGIGYWAFGPPVNTAPPQTIIIQQPPQVVYTQPPPPQTNYWFYCQSPAGYYPHVPACPGGWMQVVPNNNPPR